MLHKMQQSQNPSSASLFQHILTAAVSNCFDVSQWCLAIKPACRQVTEFIPWECFLSGLMASCTEAMHISNSWLLLSVLEATWQWNTCRIPINCGSFRDLSPAKSEVQMKGTCTNMMRWMLQMLTSLMWCSIACTWMRDIGSDFLSLKQRLRAPGSVPVFVSIFTSISILKAQLQHHLHREKKVGLLAFRKKLS